VSPDCRCGSFVTTEYVRVRGHFDYRGPGAVGACPACNIQRDAGDFREARSSGGRFDVEVEL